METVVYSVRKGFDDSLVFGIFQHEGLITSSFNLESASTSGSRNAHLLCRTTFFSSAIKQ